MEPARPVAGELVLDLLGDRHLKRGDIQETREGVCRIGPPLARELAHLLPRRGGPRRRTACRHLAAQPGCTDTADKAAAPQRDRGNRDLGCAALFRD